MSIEKNLLNAKVLYTDLPIDEAARVRAAELRSVANVTGIDVTYRVNDAQTLKTMKAIGLDTSIGEDGIEVIVARPDASVLRKYRTKNR